MGFNSGFKGLKSLVLMFVQVVDRVEFYLHLMFVDPFIMVQFIQKNPTRCNSVPEFISPYLYEAQHVSGYTPPIIRSLKLHLQPLVLYTWKVGGRVIVGRCQAQHALPDSVQQSHVQQPSTYAKPETSSAVLGSWWWAVCLPKHVELHINIE